MRKFATIASKVFELVANCSEQTVNQNTNIERKRISGLTVKSFFPINFDPKSHRSILENCLATGQCAVKITYLATSPSQRQSDKPGNCHEKYNSFNFSQLFSAIFFSNCITCVRITTVVIFISRW